MQNYTRTSCKCEYKCNYYLHFLAAATVRYLIEISVSACGADYPLDDACGATPEAWEEPGGSLGGDWEEPGRSLGGDWEETVKTGDGDGESDGDGDGLGMVVAMVMVVGLCYHCTGL